MADSKDSPVRRNKISLSGSKANRRGPREHFQPPPFTRQAKGDAEVTFLDPNATAFKAKDKVRGATGFFYDERMVLHSNPFDDDHIEKPDRLKRIRKRLEDYNLWDRCVRLDCPLATDQQLLEVHSEDHLRNMENLAKIDVETMKRKPVYANKYTTEAARLAAGSAIRLASLIWTGEIQNGVALVRPPGHHAGVEEFSGFCLCNNVALAAKQALESGASRVMIVDFDIHHGQGTQRLFYSNPNVFYWSSHRYENGRFWPHLRQSSFDAVGTEEGAGFNCNFPLNEVGVSDSDYLSIVHQVLLPLTHNFQPELILVSAGFDSAWGDPEGEMLLTPAVFGHIIHSLMAFASGRLAVVLEGGYFLDSLAESTAMTVRALLGDFCLPLARLKSSCLTSVDKTILDVKSVFRNHWKNFQVNDTFDSDGSDGHLVQFEYEGGKLKEEAEKPLAEDYVYDPRDHYFAHDREKENLLVEEIGRMLESDERIIFNRRAKSKKRLAFVYDEVMMRHKDDDDPDHPEKPERIQRIFQTHMDFKIFDRPNEILFLPSRKLAKDEACLVHEPDHWNKIVHEMPSFTASQRKEYAESLDSVYLNSGTTDGALVAAGSLLSVVDVVCNDEAEKGVAVIRPPGHHAESDSPCGFCIFNNVAIAARYAVEAHGLDRVLVVDWDVHHGNGIQNIFYETDKVLYVSLHRFDHGRFYPSKKDAGADFVGAGKGVGHNINIPWNRSGVGDTEYALAFYNVVLPVAYQYDPQLVLVSAGFDAARGDPLGRCRVSPEMYFHMTHLLSGLAGGKVILALEGGYNLNSISLSMTLCTKALLGDPAPPLQTYAPPMETAMESLREVAAHHSRYWDCLNNLTIRLPKQLPRRRENVESKSLDAVAGGGDSKFVPPEVLACNTSCTSTLSYKDDSGKKSFGSVLDSSAYNTGREHDNKQQDDDDDDRCLDAVTDRLGSSLAVSSSDTAECERGSDSNLQTSRRSGDYVPSQYGYCPGSGSTITMSNSSMCSTANSFTSDSAGGKM